MSSLRHRLKRLERVQAAVQEPFRIIVTGVGRLNLAESRCTRTLSENGGVTEVVWLNGSSNDLSEEELEKFIASFPVQRAGDLRHSDLFPPFKGHSDESDRSPHPTIGRES